VRARNKKFRQRAVLEEISRIYELEIVPKWRDI